MAYISHKESIKDLKEGLKAANELRKSGKLKSVLAKNKDNPMAFALHFVLYGRKSYGKYKPKHEITKAFRQKRKHTKHKIKRHKRRK